jgi:hypothetical protein
MPVMYGWLPEGVHARAASKPHHCPANAIDGHIRFAAMPEARRVRKLDSGLA